jgi:hypothetical protein
MQPIVLTILLPVTFFLSGFIADNTFSYRKLYNDRNNEQLTVTLANVDAAADAMVPTNKMYTYKEAIAIRTQLYKELVGNPKSLVINWALMRYYTLSPNFEGGNFGTALEYAGYIYSNNTYLGCMAYEFIYTVKKDMFLARLWYNRSLTISLPPTMHWENISYNKSDLKYIGVTGNFNNWKMQQLYETDNGSYARKVLMNKCENCVFKLIIDYKKSGNPTGKQILQYTN